MDSPDYLLGLVIALSVLVALTYGLLRFRQVNRYFVERHAASLHRRVFKPGSDPVTGGTTAGPDWQRPASDAPGGSRTPDASQSLSSPESPTARIQSGNPTLVAPELVESLTRLARVQVTRAFAQRLSMAGGGKRRYPDDEPPESIARGVLRQRVTLFGLIIVVPSYTGLVYAVAMLVLDAPRTALISLAVSLLFALLAVLWVRHRRRQIDRYFDGLGTEDQRGARVR